MQAHAAAASAASAAAAAAQSTAAAPHPPAAAGGPPTPPPINFFYSHVHDAIRDELAALADAVLSLAAAPEGELPAALGALEARYAFLAQVFRYHSSVEDEVVYPALDAKVRNVTLAYSVEHADEEALLAQLGGLLAAARSQAGSARGDTVRALVCKVEAVHTTLRKHLAKEEAQLLPLLTARFSAAEQAQLVAQFLYCIPLATVERVLAWLRPRVPAAEQASLLSHLTGVVPDALLLRLLSTWLAPAPGPPPGGDDGDGGGGAAAADAPADAAAADADAAAGECEPEAGGPGGAPPPPHWPPLHGIKLLHDSILTTLDAFVGEARALAGGTDAAAAAGLGQLLERHRFLRSVCSFHVASEEEVLLPEVRALLGDAAAGHSHGHGHGHGAAGGGGPAEAAEEEDEVALLEELGRQLADVRQYSRRGSREAASALARLVATAERVCAALRGHMAHEEASVLPLLAARLPLPRQRRLVWDTLRAMPLRLLERVMPWLVAKLSARDAGQLLATMRLGAPRSDATLVQLLSRWAERGRAGGGGDAGDTLSGGGGAFCGLG